MLSTHSFSCPGARSSAWFGLLILPIAVTSLTLGGSASAQVCLDGSTVLRTLERARALTVADFDLDGDVDLGIASSGPNGSFLFLVSKNVGHRDPPIAFQNMGGPSDFALSGDIDGDLDPDLVLLIRSNGNVGVYRNLGTGTFGNALPVGGVGLTAQPTGAVLADLDGDGDKDLAVSCFGLDAVLVRKNQNNTFEASGSFAAGDGPSSVDAGDLDGDGDVDLAVTNETAGTISVFLNTGNGTFAAAVTYSAGTRPSCVVIRDLDGVGELDMAVTNRGSNDVSVFLGAGGGAFGPPSTYATGTEPVSMTSADFDGDGDLDLATADFGSSSASVLLNQGAGTFAGVAWHDTGRIPTSIRALDFDRDGHIDLAVSCRDSRSAWILWGRGDGTFPGGGQQSAGGAPSSVAKADFDGDGDVDLAVTNEQANTVSLLENLIGGALAAPLAYAVANAPAAVVAADLDGDGDVDLAVASKGAATNNVCVLANHGDGTFAPSVPYTVGSAPVSLACGDVDGDGDNDLVVVERIIVQPNFVRVMLNQGIGTFAPPIGYGIGLGSSSVVLADLDGDLDLDIAITLEYDWAVQILQNQGNGTYVGRSLIDLSPFDATMSLASGDLDGDGDVDLAVAQSSFSSAYDGFVSFLWNAGGGVFPGDSFSTQAVAGAGMPSASAADLDGDGALELLATYSESNSVFVYSHIVNGLPTSRLQRGVGFAPDGVLAADMDGDGDVDVVTANNGSDTVSILESCSEVGDPFCFGDGSGTACPCGNTGAVGNGCATSFNPLGANLWATGRASVSNDTLVLTGSGLSSSTVTFFQGTASLGGGFVFGDGLRCAGGSVVRLGAIGAIAGVAQYPSGAALPVSIRGAIPSTSTQRHYQVWYRNAAAFCTPSTFNLSNGLTIHWVP